MIFFYRPIKMLCSNALSVELIDRKGEYALEDHTHPEYIAKGTILSDITVNAEDVLYSPADHTHQNLLVKDVIVDNTYALEHQPYTVFSPKDHTHEEYKPLA